jgi:hypothetical protein
MKKIFTEQFSRFFKPLLRIKGHVLFIVALVMIIFFETLFVLGLPREDESLIRTYAQQVIRDCAASKYRPTCYEYSIPKLMEYISMEDAFKVASVVQNQDPSFGYCHVLGHKLSATETSKDPDKWDEVIHRCPRGVCSNGCLHGAAQERFRGEVLNDEQLIIAENELMGVCNKTKSWIPTGLEEAECFHGLGHLTMYITGADLLKSMNICEKISINDEGNKFTALCYEGAFMQLFQPLDNDDKALVEGKGPADKEHLESFCRGFGSSERAEACWREGFAVHRTEVNTPKGAMAYCNNSIVKNKDHCFLMLYYAKAQSSNYDHLELSSFCDGLIPDIKPDCYGNMSNAMIHGGDRMIANAVAFCDYAKEPITKDGCLNLIVKFATYNIAPDTEAFDRLCSLMAEPYKAACYKKRIFQ